MGRLILPDTSVWIEHLRKNRTELDTYLEDSFTTKIYNHPMVFAELCLGGLTQEHEVYQRLIKFPTAPIATFKELIIFIEENKLKNKGIGYVDANLIASCLLHKSHLMLITRDKKLKRIAEEFGVYYEVSR
jgi:predicted nucleic acid-binding protein